MLIGFDTETFLIERALLAPPMVCCQHYIGGLSDADVTHAKEAEPLLHGLLSYADPLVGHNIAYDMAVICATYP